MPEIKRIDPKEFQEMGYLQEVNRQFLHPLGMALEVIVDNETGEVSFGGIWDYRHIPDGMRFAEGVIDTEKADRVRTQWEDKEKIRLEELGWIIQPVEN